MRNYTTRRQAFEFYRDTITEARKLGPEQEKLAIEEIARHDLYFLGSWILDRAGDFDFGSPERQEWIFQRCRDVQLEPNGRLDLWARFHYKTSIITQLLTVQDIVNDPEVTIGLFSFNNKAARQPYMVIKRYLEYLGKMNMFLDVLYYEPEKEAPAGTWTIDEGLSVKREGNPREPTLSSWGLVDSQPTGNHFKIRLYDDVVTPAEVTNTDMIKKAVAQWELSLNLTSNLPVKHYGYGNISRYVGTRYHFNDPYKTIMERKAATPRVFPATVDGKPTGKPVFLTQEELNRFREEQGSYTFACQLLLNPVADDAQGFKYEWICWDDNKDRRQRHWWRERGLNVYVLCDPANEKKRDSDYTVILAIGLGPDQNFYLVDGIRDRMNLTERTEALIRFRQKYMPVKVGYEKYGKDADIDHIKYVQGQTNRRFPIVPLGGKMAKNDRIRRLIPLFETGRFWIPPYLNFIDSQGKQRNLTTEFVKDEYEAFPVGIHDDMLDCMARILDPELNATFPEDDAYDDQYDSYEPEKEYDPLNYMTAGN